MAAFEFIFCNLSSGPGFARDVWRLKGAGILIITILAGVVFYKNFVSAASEPSAVFEFFNVSGPENERAKKNNVICSRSEFYKVERTKLRGGIILDSIRNLKNLHVL